MRRFIKYISICCLALMAVVAMPDKAAAQDDEITFQDFYDDLQQYGTWLDDPGYGSVWVPDVDQDFRPYATNGHWVMTEYGNTWVSDYDWGWAPFHYGRWRFDDYYGWEWIPGYEWGPAWVDWRSGDGYYGWAPLGPDVSLDVAFSNDYSIPEDYWVFAPQIYINSPVIYNYYVPRPRVVNIIRRTSIINNFYSRNNRRYIAGPRVLDVERVTRNRVQVYNINNLNRPDRHSIHNNTLNIYRPAVRRVDYAQPTRVVNASAYRNANPNFRIGDRSRGAVVNHQNAARLANVARSNDAANRNWVRINNNRSDNRPNNDRDGRPATRPSVPYQNNRPDWNNRQNGNNNWQQRSPQNQNGQQISDQQRKEAEQRRQQFEQRRQQQNLPGNPPRPQRPEGEQPNQGDNQRWNNGQQRQQENEQRRQQQATQQQNDQQRQQREQQRQEFEQRRQREQQDNAQRQQANQQRDQQRQQFEQRRQQAEQQRQQADQQRQQQEQRRQQQDQQQAQMRQQQEQQRQAQQQEQQRQREQQRQQADQQRQQRDQAEQQRRQQMEQQRQQQDQQREQQRQQQEQQRAQAQQQRQQQAEQQRQQREQQQEQQRQRPQRGERRP